MHKFWPFSLSMLPASILCLFGLTSCGGNWPVLDTFAHQYLLNYSSDLKNLNCLLLSITSSSIIIAFYTHLHILKFSFGNAIVKTNRYGCQNQICSNNKMQLMRDPPSRFWHRQGYLTRATPTHPPTPLFHNF